MSLPVQFERRSAGTDLPPLFMAELGALFNQDVGLAERLVREIAQARAGDGKLPLLLKGEILHDPSICLDDQTQQTYLSKSGERKQERYRDLIERKALPLASYGRILRVAREQGLSFCLSVYDRVGADFAVDQGAVALKTSSSNLTHVPLIRYVAKKGVPVIIDTGRGSLAEVDRAVRTAKDAGAPTVVVQHSQDGHPAPAENCNLRTLQTLRQAFGCPVGISDHYATTQMLHVAIGLGVDLIERNIAAYPDALEQDHAFSSGSAELPSLLTSLHNSWKALGRAFRDPRNKSGLVSTSARMGLVARRDIAADEHVSEEIVSFAFPLKGIPAEHFDDVAGCRFRLPVRAGQPIRWSDVDRH